jgi:hypothetical protein
VLAVCSTGVVLGLGAFGLAPDTATRRLTVRPATGPRTAVP